VGGSSKTLSDQPDVDELDEDYENECDEVLDYSEEELELNADDDVPFKGLPEGISQSQSFDEDFMMHNRVLEESEGLF